MLSHDELIWKRNLGYIEDIYINEDVVLTMNIRKQLEKFELRPKNQQNLKNGASVLGLDSGGSMAVCGGSNK